MTAQGLEIAGVIEEALAKHPAFGDSDYILDQLESVSIKRLERLAEALPSAGALLLELRRADAAARCRIVGNTVIRCAVQHAFTFLETRKEVGLTLQECDGVFQGVVRHLADGGSGNPFENGACPFAPLSDQSHDTWIWDEDYPNDVFGAAFRKILDLEYGDRLCSISPDELAMLRRGEALLRELLPELAASALRHVHQIGCFPDQGFWQGKVSSSQIRMGGIIFLNRALLRNPWCTAEHLLHESLHQKLYDFRHGHSLLDVDAPQDDAPRVVSLWNAQEFNRSNHWDTHRAFAAFHVYAQLALLAKVAERRAPELEARYGRFCGMVQSRKALDRAWYLGEKLKDECSSHLGLAGFRMRDWLMSVLAHLDDAPPPHGAYIHLMLDLYEREANRLEAAMSGDSRAAAAFESSLVPKAQAEREAAQRILRTIGAMSELQRLDQALERQVGDDVVRNFPTQRRLIARALLEASPDGFSLKARAPEGVDVDRMVRELVESGSDALYVMQSNVPPRVAGAKRRAKDLRVKRYADDQFGRLLAVLAAAVRSRGRILEIGTRSGVGLAWIVTGLGARRDVDVVSTEGDARLTASVGELGWPETVSLLTGEATELLPGLGAFDLILAGASPEVCGGLDSILPALRTGGVLVVDQQGQDAEACSTLRAALLHHPELQAVELDLSSRVIVATRVERAETRPSMAVADVPRRAPAYAGTG
jgi:predicted O-methyltransferase YrrM